MTSTALNLGEIAAFWRNARRLYTIYSALNRTFEIGLPLCRDLEYPIDRSEPEIVERVRTWFDDMDTRVQVWQLRQLLQSTNLQTEENLRALLRRHMDHKQNTEVDRDKIDFLLVQYFAHCAPPGLYEQQISLVEVSRVLEPVLGTLGDGYPEWVEGLDSKLEKLNQCNSLEELQKLGALREVRELKLSLGEGYFDNACLVTFTRFNFLARRAFFRAMHLDLHAIRNVINDLEARGITEIDCSGAGLAARESMEHIRHVVHQWKTPFRAPYTGGASFGQLILLRHSLQKAVEQSTAGPTDGQVVPAKPGSATASAPSKAEASGTGTLEDFLPPAAPAADSTPIKEKQNQEKIALDVPAAPELRPEPPLQRISMSAVAPPPLAVPRIAPLAAPVNATPVPTAAAAVSAGAVPEPVPASPPAQAEDDYLSECVADIAQQLKAMPARKSAGVSAI
ncbi:MAG TPA: hypothetical protein VNW97_21530, partial [Candidatus Saccharimonadales bacterium]|nr:hypothetical protein [Candidatus Saccharimonadales bacterium]